MNLQRAHPIRHSVIYSIFTNETHAIYNIAHGLIKKILAVSLNVSNVCSQKLRLLMLK